MSDGDMLNELGISIATASPTLRERQSALVVMLVITVGFPPINLNCTKSSLIWLRMPSMQ